jgi:hypothetical protein
MPKVMTDFISRRCLFVAFAVLASCAAICGCNRGPKVVKITGVCTRGGQPVKDLAVTFQPAQGRPSWGYTDPQGRFTLHYTKEREGAAVGAHRVIVHYQPQDVEVYNAITAGTYDYPPDLKAIEEKYGSLETTPLKFDVQKEQEIELKLD